MNTGTQTWPTSREKRKKNVYLPHKGVIIKLKLLVNRYVSSGLWIVLTMIKVLKGESSDIQIISEFKTVHRVISHDLTQPLSSSYNWECDLPKFTGNAINNDYMAPSCFSVICLFIIHLFNYLFWRRLARIHFNSYVRSETVSVAMLQQEQYPGKCNIMLMESGSIFHAWLVQSMLRTRGMRNQVQRQKWT